MAVSSKTPIWRSNWLLALLLTLAVFVIYQSTNAIEGLERRFYDAASTQIERKAASNIAVIAIDESSIANIGRWPWPRDVHAKLIDKLAAAKAKTIG